MQELKNKSRQIYMKFDFFYYKNQISFTITTAKIVLNIQIYHIDFGQVQTQGLANFL